jgi:copper chaperone NosL
MKKRIFLLLTVPLALTSCNIGPEPIHYGSDACHSCSMTIVDQRHAAQYVTKKGKAFKFDSIECMMNGLEESDQADIAMYVVDDFSNPGKLIDATRATYLISKNIPSPMGANLSAFENGEAAGAVQSQQNGELFTWQQVRGRFTIK